MEVEQNNPIIQETPCSHQSWRDPLFSRSMIVEGNKDMKFNIKAFQALNKKIMAVKTRDLPSSLIWLVVIFA